MKPPRRLAFILTLAGLTAVSAARAEIEFSAYLRVAGTLKFSLADPAAGKGSEWLALGGRFDGYTLIGFDEKKETLAVERAGAITQLPLKPAEVQRASQSDDARLAAPLTLVPVAPGDPRRVPPPPDLERASAERRRMELTEVIDRIGDSRPAIRPSGSSFRFDPSGPSGVVVLEPVVFTDAGQSGSRTVLRNSSGRSVVVRVEPSGPPTIPDFERLLVDPTDTRGVPRVDLGAHLTQTLVERERLLRTLQDAQRAQLSQPDSVSQTLSAPAAAPERSARESSGVQEEARRLREKLRNLGTELAPAPTSPRN